MSGCQTGRVICCQCIRVNQNSYQILRIAHRNYSNHYETLKLKPNCTSKEIRDSFIKLSKENHPDTSTSQNASENAKIFRSIVEAYKVLGKADSRAVYDAAINERDDLMRYSSVNSHPNIVGAYHGVFGSKRVSNTTIVLYCILFMIVGAIVQALAIRYSATLQRDKLDNVSMEAGKMLSIARANAEKHGNDHQINKLIQKFNDGK